MAIAFPVAILLTIFTIALFQFKEAIGANFVWILWGSILGVSYLLAVGVHLLSQYMSCHTIQSSKAFLGGLASALTSAIALGVSSLAWCRLPVASVIAPFMAPTAPASAANASAAACCTPALHLEPLERKIPLLSGVSYGFYVFFGSLYGILIGNGLSSIC